MNKKILTGTFLILFICINLFSEDYKAKNIALEAAKFENAAESVEYIKSILPKMEKNSEKRSVYILLGTIQEQMAYYSDACTSFANAAGIAGSNAEGMPKKTNEQLVLDAVRCALSCGDFLTADNYLNSSVRNSKNDKIQSYIKLYTQWSALCHADSVMALQEPIALLQAYLKVDSMKEVHPAILLTLWYVTGEKNYSLQITKNFPLSVEAAIVRGDIQLMPSPFWFFVPKSGEVEVGAGSYSENISMETSDLVENSNGKDSETEANKKTENSTDNKSKNDKSDSEKKSILQLGLFRTELNAKLLMEEVNKKGFKSYITTETRASGTTYYIVLIEENEKNTIGDELRSAGYECYIVN